MNTCCNILLCFGKETVYLILSDISAGLESHSTDTVPCAPDSCSKAYAGECTACDAEAVSDN